MKKKNKDRLDKWFTENYEWLRNEVGSNIAKGKMSDYRDDLVSLVVEAAYNLSDEKVEQMLDDDMLQWWFLRSAGLQLRSSSSPFYTQFRRHKFSAREFGLPNSDKNIFEGIYEEYNADLELCFQREYDNLHWYLQTLLRKHFLERQSLTKMYKYYNISKTHLVKDINRGINIIRENCKHCS